MYEESARSFSCGRDRACEGDASNVSVFPLVSKMRVVVPPERSFVSSAFFSYARYISSLSQVGAFGGRNSNWGPQQHMQLKELIEEAHMGLRVSRRLE